MLARLWRVSDSEEISVGYLISDDDVMIKTIGKNNLNEKIGEMMNQKIKFK